MRDNGVANSPLERIRITPIAARRYCTMYVQANLRAEGTRRVAARSETASAERARGEDSGWLRLVERWLLRGGVPTIRGVGLDFTSCVGGGARTFGTRDVEVR